MVALLIFFYLHPMSFCFITKFKNFLWKCSVVSLPSFFFFFFLIKWYWWWCCPSSTWPRNFIQFNISKENYFSLPNSILIFMLKHECLSTTLSRQGFPNFRRVFSCIIFPWRPTISKSIHNIKTNMVFGLSKYSCIRID